MLCNLKTSGDYKYYNSKKFISGSLNFPFVEIEMSTTFTHSMNCFLCGEEPVESSLNSAIPKERGPHHLGPFKRTNVQLQDRDAQCERSLFRLLQIHTREIPQHSYVCKRCRQLIRDVDFSIRAISSLRTQILHLRRLVLCKLDSKAATLDLEECRRRQTNSNTKEKRQQFRAFFKKVQEKRSDWRNYDFLANEDDGSEISNESSGIPGKTWSSAAVVPTSSLQPNKTRITDTGIAEEEDTSHFCLVVSSDETPSTSATEARDLMSSYISCQNETNSSLPKFEGASANSVEISKNENDLTYSRTSNSTPHHFYVNKVLQCPSCPKKFKWKHNLKQHVEIHAGKIFTCTDCTKTFPTLRYLQLHRKRHVGKIFTCSDCPLTFSTYLHLRRHRKAHVKPFQCPACAKTFVNNFNLRRHQKHFQQGQGCIESEVILGS